MLPEKTLQSLERLFVAAKRVRPAKLATDLSDVPEIGGVYGLWRRGNLKYFGETCHLRHRIEEITCKGRHHSLNLLLGSRAKGKNGRQKAAWICSSDVLVAWLPISLGRVEFEEYMVLKYSKRFTKASQRLLNHQNQRFSLRSDSAEWEALVAKPMPVLTPIHDDMNDDCWAPSRNHARIAQNLGALLHVFRPRYETYQQLSLDLDGWTSIPDLCAYPTGTLPNDWANDEDVCRVAPALVVEILSPKQNLQPLLDKVRQYLAHGVKSCWVIVPGTGTVSLFPATGGSRSVVEGDIVDPVLDLRVPVAGVFA